MAMPWIDEKVWEQAVIPPWKLAVLRVAFPRRKVVQLRGKTYLIRP